jgi:hypothetical protein
VPPPVHPLAMRKMQSVFFNLAAPIKLAGMALLMVLFMVARAGATSTEDEIAALKAQKNDAVFKVEDIVNQPITHVKLTPDMSVSHYDDGWFHPGATMPDFDHVDVRKTQSFPYEGEQYVTSPANPGEVFLGSELEFNSMTKFFYTDRLLPKKKLTEDEMLQINQLYRIIGQCNDRLYDLENPLPLQTQIHYWINAHKPVVVAVVGVLLVTLVFVRLRRRASSEY